MKERLLLKLANTKIGRKYLGVPEGKQIITITDRYVHYLRGEFSKDGLPLITSMGSRTGDRRRFKFGLFTLSKEFLINQFPTLALWTLGIGALLLPDLLNIGLLAMYPSVMFFGTTTGVKFASTTGFDIPGFGAGGVNDFTDPTNIYADDGNYTTAGSVSSEYQSYNGFDFGIFSGATIDGIELKVKSHKTNVSGQGIVFGIYNGGPYRIKNYDPNLTTDTIVTLGSSSDLWGGTWSDTEFADGSMSLYIGVPATTQTISFDYFTMEITFSGGTPPVSLPTVTTQAVTGIAEETATGNGNITNTGGENNDKRGFVYDTSSQSLPGDVAPGSSGYGSFVEDSGSYGTGAFTKTLTDLFAGQTYYVRAYSHNSEGYSYGGEVNFETDPFTQELTETVGVASPNTIKDISRELLETVMVSSINTLKITARIFYESIVAVSTGAYQILSKVFFEHVFMRHDQHTDVFPPAQNDTYVKATTSRSNYFPYYATDPTKSSTGVAINNQWQSNGGITNQRFHIDLGESMAIGTLRYENAHNNGGQTNKGVQDFTFWGSNDSAAFADLTYANDTGWTQIFLSETTMFQHIGSNIADVRGIELPHPAVEYRYYAFKFANNWGAGTDIGIRTIIFSKHQDGFIRTIKTFVENLTVEATRAITRGKLFIPKISVGAITSSIWTRYRIFTESFTVAVNFVKSIGKIFTNFIRMAEALTQSISKTFVEAIEVAVVFVIARFYIFAEVVAISLTFGSFAIGKLFEEIVKIVTVFEEGRARLNSEVIAVGETLVLLSGKLLKEVINIVSTFARVVNKVLLEAVRMVDTAFFKFTRYKVLTETINVLDTAITAVALIFTEVINVIGTLASFVIGKVITQIIRVVDTFGKESWNLSRVFSETINMAETFAKTRGRELTEVLTVVSEFVLETISKLLLETVSVGVTFIKISLKVFIEIVNVVSIALNESVKVFIETITVSSSFVIDTISKLFIEIVNIAETYTKIWILSKTFTEVVQVVATSLNQAGRTLAENITVGGEFILGTISKVFVEIVNVAEIYTRLITRVFTEVINVVDTLLNQAGKIFTEVVSVVNPAIAKLKGVTYSGIVGIGRDKIKLVLNGIQVGLWKKVARVVAGAWKKISRNDN